MADDCCPKTWRYYLVWPVFKLMQAMLWFCELGTPRRLPILDGMVPSTITPEQEARLRAEAETARNRELHDRLESERDIRFLRLWRHTETCAACDKLGGGFMPVLNPGASNIHWLAAHCDDAKEIADHAQFALAHDDLREIYKHEGSPIPPYVEYLVGGVESVGAS